MLLQAVLTSFYVTMTMVMYFKRKRSPESFEIRHIQDAKFGDRFLHAFYGTVSDFFLTSIIFDLGLAIGVITHLATKEHARGSPLGFASTTDRVVPAVPGGGQDSGAYLLVASFSLLSMAGVLPTFLSNSRRQWLRACMICSMVWILGSAALVWSAVIAGSHSGLRDDYQRDFCPDEYLPETYHSVSFGSITLGVLLPPIFGASVAFASFICCCGWREMWKRDWVRHTVRGSIVSFSAVCFFLNWATLVLLLVFLSGTSWFMRTSWGVGQGLALAMWMPLLWEIIYMMIGESRPFVLCPWALRISLANNIEVGIDRGSETRLQKEFFVLREGEVEDIPELVPGSILGPRGRSHAGLVEQAQGTSQMQPVPARQMAMSSNMPTSPPEPNLQSEVRMMDRYA